LMMEWMTFLIEANRELHRRLVSNGTPQDYSEKPGSHTWVYWQNSLPYHALYFANVFKQMDLQYIEDIICLCLLFMVF